MANYVSIYKVKGLIIMLHLIRTLEMVLAYSAIYYFYMPLSLFVLIKKLLVVIFLHPFPLFSQTVNPIYCIN